jgi:hypothetical protein
MGRAAQIRVPPRIRSGLSQAMLDSLSVNPEDGACPSSPDGADTFLLRLRKTRSYMRNIGTQEGDVGAGLCETPSDITSEASAVVVARVETGSHPILQPKTPYEQQRVSPMHGGA